MDGKIISGIVLLCTVCIYCFFYFFAFNRVSNGNAGRKLTSFMNDNISDSFKITPSGLLGILAVILFIISMTLTGIGASEKAALNPAIDRNTTTVPNLTPGQNANFRENFGENTSTYSPIGFGPVLDKVKVRNWLNATDNSTWPDGNGDLLKISKDQFKTGYGFIPPSFSYFPKGQTKNDYNATNYKSGRENCMQACSLTNCTAVQTEVPENCSQKAGPNGGTSCGSNSEFSCTLFYNNIKDADDAYWKINNFSSGIGVSNSVGCFENTGSSCLGKKYYEDSAVPIGLPNSSSKPSENIVTYCDPSVTKTNSAGYGIVGSSCSCSGPVGGDNCKDPNCCVMRPLLTTEFAQKNYPYFSVPINVSKTVGESVGNYSMTVPTINFKNGVGTKCGVVGSGADQKLVSCMATKPCSSDSDTSDCWKVDTSSCSGEVFNESSGASALNTYKANYAAHKGQNYDDLYPSCYYRQKLTIVEPIQFNCDPSNVTRGCYGNPPILYTSSLTSSGGFAACSDTSVIPSTERCQNSGDIASCEGFPYSCSTSNGTNTLWVKQ